MKFDLKLEQAVGRMAYLGCIEECDELDEIPVIPSVAGTSLDLDSEKCERTEPPVARVCEGGDNLDHNQMGECQESKFGLSVAVKMTKNDINCEKSERIEPPSTMLIETEDRNVQKLRGGDPECIWAECGSARE